MGLTVWKEHVSSASALFLFHKLQVLLKHSSSVCIWFWLSDYLDSNADCNGPVREIYGQTVRVIGHGAVQEQQGPQSCSLTLKSTANFDHTNIRLSIVAATIRDCDVRLTIYDGDVGQGTLVSVSACVPTRLSLTACVPLHLCAFISACLLFVCVWYSVCVSVCAAALFCTAVNILFISSLCITILL